MHSINSQTSKPITSQTRDNIVTKLYERKELIEENKVLQVQIQNRDTTITVQKEIIAVQLQTLKLKDFRIENLEAIINNKDTIIELTEKKVKKAFLKGLGGGVLVGLIFLLL